jgi:thiamine pyrophosphate-dependent acetolactate synthase large subunit-like protein
MMAPERDSLKVSNKKFGSLAVGGNYAAMARSLNVESARVEKPEDIAAALGAAINVIESGRPYLLEFLVKEGYQFSRYA